MSNDSAAIAAVDFQQQVQQPGTVYLELPIEQLHESPFNPRKTFRDIASLADTIKAAGRILQPLLVRPRPPKLQIVDDPINGGLTDAEVAQEGFEIVFGHRRWRAAEHAGLATAPCMVRAMTDAESRQAQIIENLARDDVHPIEEAEGYESMMARDGYTADALAEKFGKSRSYIYGRLKLLQAAPAVRQAFVAGEIGSENALALARLRTDRLQEKALAWIKGKNIDLQDGGRDSTRDVRRALNERFTLPLAKALFDREDRTLVPDAGTCSYCPKRSGNAPEYSDVVAAAEKRGDYQSRDWRDHLTNDGDQVCTDPDCWDAKKSAHLARAAAQLAANGATVVTGNKARAAVGVDGDVKGAYIALDDARKLLKQAGVKAAAKKGQAAAGEAPAVVTIQDPRNGKLVKAMRREDLAAAGAPAPVKKKADDTWQERQRRQEEERKVQEAKAHAESERRYALLLRVREAVAARTRDAFDLRLATAAALGGVEYAGMGALLRLYGVKDKGTLVRRVDAMTVDELTTLMMDCALVDHVVVSHYSMGSKPGPLLAMANHCGIDPKTVQAPAKPDEKPAAPTKAAQAKKGAPSVKYRDPMTGSTWSGRGLQPRWLKVAIEDGAALADFEVGGPAKRGEEDQKDEAGSAGERDPNTSDMFDGAPA